MSDKSEYYKAALRLSFWVAFKQGVAVLLFYALAIPCGAFLDYLSFKTWETDWKEQAAVATGISVLWFVGRFVYTFLAVTRQRDAE